VLHQRLLVRVLGCRRRRVRRREHFSSVFFFSFSSLGSVAYPWEDTLTRGRTRRKKKGAFGKKKLLSFSERKEATSHFVRARFS
jgi:hypothetical protein